MLSLAAAAFAGGLLGGVHCMGMCGGIAAALGAASGGAALRRQAAFNAGRIASYAIAGGAAGTLGALAAPVYGAQVALAAIATILMVLLGAYVAGWGGLLLRLEAAGGFLWRRVEPLRRHLVPIDSDAKAFGAGAVWGWVPCGLVYSMLALGLATGTAAGGSLVMLAFGLGTVPAMLAAGVAAHRLLELRRSPRVRLGAGMAIIALAFVGLLRTPQVAELVALGWQCVS